MTVAELAQELGRSHQAIYKRIAKAGLKMADLRDSATGQLTPQGVEAIRNLYAGNSAGSCAKGAQQDAQELARLRAEVEELRKAAADALHRAELADVKTAAAENERDFLRQQLDAAIKANALASMKRLTAPEEQSAGADPQQLHTFAGRIKAAWAALRNK